MPDTIKDFLKSNWIYLAVSIFYFLFAWAMFMSAHRTGGHVNKADFKSAFPVLSNMFLF